MSSVHLQERLDLHHAKRVVQQMVDLMLDEEFTFLGLTTLKAADSYTFYHSVNVCIYALALGKRAGMSRTQLCELGLGALMHDLGKAKIPIEILRKQGPLTTDEWRIVRQHPHLGVKELIRMRGLSTIAYRSMIGCFEHHLFYNGSPSGYPPLRRPYRLHVAGRIVSIADSFDAMTTKRVYMDRAYRRDRALSFLVSEAGRRFDPVLVRIFANLIGVFPVGTAVRLRSGRLAVVIAVSPDPNLCHRPIVRPISDESGFATARREYEAVDLSRKGADGAYPDEIVSALDPETIGIEVARYFI
jgi:HD-GYP domain-containing protein (c-di-GMP phosphodiesterase class II)